MSRAIDIRLGDLDDPQIADLIRQHVRGATSDVDARCDHALTVDELRRPDIALWSAWDGETLLGVAALKTLSDHDGELKSMHTAKAARGHGVGRALLDHVLAQASAQGLRMVSLETGSWAYFDAARALYEKRGFTRCAVFGDYPDHPLSVFMNITLGD